MFESAGLVSRQPKDATKITRETDNDWDLPTANKENEKNAEHDVSNVAVHIVECCQKWQSIGTQEVIVAHVFISRVV